MLEIKEGPFHQKQEFIKSFRLYLKPIEVDSFFINNILISGYLIANSTKYQLFDILFIFFHYSFHL